MTKYGKLAVFAFVHVLLKILCKMETKWLVRRL